VPSPLVLDGLVYTIKNGGILTILRADTGEVVKTGRVRSAPASYSASPVATGGRIYFANEDGIVVVVRAGKDSEALAANDLGEPLFATPALSERRIYVRGAEIDLQFRREVSAAIELHVRLRKSLAHLLLAYCVAQVCYAGTRDHCRVPRTTGVTARWSKSRTPEPRRTAAMSTLISSRRPAFRSCWMVSAPW
jgi:hypothetical protein